MALQARAGLLLLGHAARLLLVEERVGVAAPVAVVDGEGVAGEDAPEPRIPVELLLGRAGVAGAEAAPAVLRRRRQRRLEVASRTRAASSGPRPSGPCVSSVTSTRRTNGWRASCLRSKMLVSSASSSTVRPATASEAQQHQQPGPSRTSRRRSCRLPRRDPLSRRAMSGAGVAVQAVDARRAPAPRLASTRGRTLRGTARSSPARSVDRAA